MVRAYRALVVVHSPSSPPKQGLTRRARVGLASVAIAFLVFPLGYGLVWSILHGPPEAAVFLAGGVLALSLVALGIRLRAPGDVLMAWGLLVTGILMIGLSAYVLLSPLLTGSAGLSQNPGWYVLLLLFGILVSVGAGRRVRGHRWRTE